MTSEQIRQAANIVFKDGVPKFPDEAKLIWMLSEIAAQLAELNEYFVSLQHTYAQANVKAQDED